MGEPEYDEVTCITAGEIRAAGIAVPGNIPDCGWVPRTSLQYETVAAPARSPKLAKGVVAMTIRVRFSQPFRWIAIDVTIDADTSGAA